MLHQNFVFLLNADKTPLNPIHPARARELQNHFKSAVFRTYPYVLILKEQIENPELIPIRLKIDPGSKYTGLALQRNNSIIFLMELKHRGSVIKTNLQTRKGFRQGRRSRNLRYRRKRFNRKKPNSWLAPSLQHRVDTTETWIKRFQRYAPIEVVEIEQVRFDTQQLENPEIKGVEYQQGTLQGYETKFNRITQGFAKTHSIDAACVGDSGEQITFLTNQPLLVDCRGHGNRQARRVNGSGFPAVKKAKIVYKHCIAGDIVQFTNLKARKNLALGKQTMRIKTPTAKGFEVQNAQGRTAISSLTGVRFIHRNDGYSYRFG